MKDKQKLQDIELQKLVDKKLKRVAKLNEIQSAIKLLESNGYVVHTKFTFTAALNNASHGRTVIVNDSGHVIGLQG